MLFPNKQILKSVLSTVFIMLVLGLIIFVGTKLLEHRLHEHFFV